LRELQRHTSPFFSRAALRGEVWLAIRSHRVREVAKYGQEWIRTTEGVKPADLQSVQFS
jgi:hypothetical protein